MKLSEIAGVKNLSFRLQNARFEAQKEMGYLAEFMYNKHKGILPGSSRYSWEGLMEESLNKLPSLEHKFRTFVSSIHEIVKNHPEHIPEGIYCYNEGTCPYWESNPFAGNQNSGICIFRNEYDSDEPMGLLWDQVKSCGINEGFEDTETISSKELILKYPELFGEPPFDVRKTLIAFGFECGDGWFPILIDLFEKFAKIVKEEKITDFRFTQIKEKFGTLRIYTQGTETEEMRTLLREAEAKSGSVCENCGAPATTEWGGWVTTLCEKCKKHP